MLSVDANLKMEVGAGGPAGGTDLSQRLAPGDFLANGDQGWRCCCQPYKVVMPPPWSTMMYFP